MTDDYELVDAGDGRRLERFGSRLVDRPAPSATLARGLDAEAWRRADPRFDRATGWDRAVEPWTCRLDGLTLELRPTPAGQVGIFPEHASLWPALRETLGPRTGAEVLNLFAYTGATTLALAREGARVAHVDASRPSVGWARRNAALSGLGDAPVRWLVDDVPAFLAREIRRGRGYRGVVLDPPTYGHGRGSRAWRIDDDLEALLEQVARLVEPAGFVLLTTHSVGWDANRLAEVLSDALAADQVDAGDLVLPARSGGTLRLGSFGRVIIRS